jgi:membrane-bound metal-dependent hydrolase YbcI (DUF457 family)
MADRRTHIVGGVATGVGYSAFQAKEQSTPNLVTEMVGGAAGGYVGALLPDFLEPALSSWHRSAAHSCTAGAAIVYSKDVLAGFEKFCREQADLCALQHKTLQMRPDPWQPNVFVPAPADPFMLLSLKIAEVCWRFLAGFANGLAAGYISHLALDAVTPRSIPLLTRGF